MTARPVDVVLLGGAPGSGKSTTLAALRPMLQDGAVIDLDTVWGMLGGDPFTSATGYAIALRQAVKLARGFLAEGRRPVVLAAPFDVAALPYALALFDGVEVLAVALVCDRGALRQRLIARPAGLFRDAHAALDVDQALRASARHHIDTGWHAPDVVARYVVRLLRTGSFAPARVGDAVEEPSP